MIALRITPAGPTGAVKSFLDEAAVPEATDEAAVPEATVSPTAEARGI